MTRLTVHESEIARLLKKADGLSKGGRLDEAERVCASVIQAHPDSYMAYEMRSSVYRRAGNLKAAVEDMNHVVRLNPNNAAPRFRRGRYLMIQGDCQRAIADFSEAFSLDACYFGDALYLCRAEAYLRNRQFSEAIADCQAIDDGKYGESSFFGHAYRSCADIEAEARAQLGKKTS